MSLKSIVYKSELSHATLLNVAPVYVDVLVSVRPRVLVEKPQSMHDLMHHSSNPLTSNADGDLLFDVVRVPSNS